MQVYTTGVTQLASSSHVQTIVMVSSVIVVMYNLTFPCLRSANYVPSAETVNCINQMKGLSSSRRTLDHMIAVQQITVVWLRATFNMAC